MLVRAYSDDDVVTYVPAYNGNRELPEEQQMEVDLIPLSHKRKQRYMRLIKAEPVSRKSKEIRTNGAEITKKMMVENIKTIRNFQIEGKGGNIIDIKTGKDLYEHDVDSELMEELMEALEDRS